MSKEEITAIYGQTALLRLLGVTNHRIIENNKLEWIEIRLERIKITLPITTDYKTIKRIIKKELIKYTHHKSLTPKLYHTWLCKPKPISKSFQLNRTVKQEPLLDQDYLYQEKF